MERSRAREPPGVVAARRMAGRRSLALRVVAAAASCAAAASEDVLARPAGYDTTVHEVITPDSHNRIDWIQKNQDEHAARAAEAHSKKLKTDAKKAADYAKSRDCSADDFASFLDEPFRGPLKVRKTRPRTGSSSKDLAFIGMETSKTPSGKRVDLYDFRHPEKANYPYYVVPVRMPATDGRLQVAEDVAPNYDSWFEGYGWVEVKARGPCGTVDLGWWYSRPDGDEFLAMIVRPSWRLGKPAPASRGEL